MIDTDAKDRFAIRREIVLEETGGRKVVLRYAQKLVTLDQAAI